MYVSTIVHKILSEQKGITLKEFEKNTSDRSEHYLEYAKSIVSEYGSNLDSVLKQDLERMFDVFQHKVSLFGKSGLEDIKKRISKAIIDDISFIYQQTYVLANEQIGKEIISQANASVGLGLLYKYLKTSFSNPILFSKLKTTKTIYNFAKEASINKDLEEDLYHALAEAFSSVLERYYDMNKTLIEKITDMEWIAFAKEYQRTKLKLDNIDEKIRKQKRGNIKELVQLRKALIKKQQMLDEKKEIMNAVGKNSDNVNLYLKEVAQKDELEKKQIEIDNLNKTIDDKNKEIEEVKQEIAKTKQMLNDVSKNSSQILTKIKDELISISSWIAGLVASVLLYEIAVTRKSKVQYKFSFRNIIPSIKLLFTTSFDKWSVVMIFAVVVMAICVYKIFDKVTLLVKQLKDAISYISQFLEAEKQEM